jgi:hypothetical protein
VVTLHRRAAAACTPGADAPVLLLRVTRVQASVRFLSRHLVQGKPTVAASQRTLRAWQGTQAHGFRSSGGGGSSDAGAGVGIGEKLIRRKNLEST